MFIIADFLRQSSQFGFLEELQAKLGADEGQIMWDAFNDVFDCLPLTGIIGGLRRQRVLFCPASDKKHMATLRQAAASSPCTADWDPT